MTKLRLATVGTSIITDYFIDAVRKLETVELVSVYSRAQDKAEAFAKKHHVNHYHTDFDALAKDPDIDLVYLASPNKLHYAQALQLLKAHKHVIVEKPFTHDLKSFEHLMQVAKQVNRFCFDAIMPIHLPNFKVLKEHLFEIGDLRLSNSMQVQYSSRYDALKAGKVENIFDPKMAGGALMDLGIYPVTLACALFGLPKSSHYVANKHSNGIDLSGVLSLQYDDHIFNCVIAKDCASHNETVLIGEKATLKIEGSISRVDSVEIISKNDHKNHSVDQIDNRMFYELKDFVECILNEDFVTYDGLNQITRDALTVLEKSKKDIGLDFGDDAIITQ